MKKALLALAAVATMAMAFTSCVTTNYESGSVDTLKVNKLAVKDYEVIKPVKVTTSVTDEKSVLMIHQSKVGSEVVYSLLQEEIVKAGGHDIINVRISKKVDSNLVFGGIFGSKVETTYTATGLVIKYTNATLKTTAYDADGKVAATSDMICSAPAGIVSGGASGIVAKIKSFLPF